MLGIEEGMQGVGELLQDDATRDLSGSCAVRVPTQPIHDRQQR
jgi:hypothetical protein